MGRRVCRWGWSGYEREYVWGEGGRGDGCRVAYGLEVGWIDDGMRTWAARWWMGWRGGGERGDRRKRGVRDGKGGDEERGRAGE